MEKNQGYVFDFSKTLVDQSDLIKKFMEKYKDLMEAYKQDPKKHQHEIVETLDRFVLERNDIHYQVYRDVSETLTEIKKLGGDIYIFSKGLKEGVQKIVKESDLSTLILKDNILTVVEFGFDDKTNPEIFVNLNNLLNDRDRIFYMYCDDERKNVESALNSGVIKGRIYQIDRKIKDDREDGKISVIPSLKSIVDNIYRGG